MSKLLILFLIPVASASILTEETAMKAVKNIIWNTVQPQNETCNAEISNMVECFSGIQNYAAIFEDYDTLSNQTYMTELISKLEDSSDCVGEPTCSSTLLLKYLVDGAVFVGENVYGDSFECFFNKGNFPDKLEECTDDEPETLDDLRAIAKCTARILDCNEDDQERFVKAAYAAIDMLQNVLDIENFSDNVENMHFNATYYEGIHW